MILGFYRHKEDIDIWYILYQVQVHKCLVKTKPLPWPVRLGQFWFQAINGLLKPLFQASQWPQVSFLNLSSPNCYVGDSREFGAILQWQEDVQTCLYLLILYILHDTPWSIFDIDRTMQNPWTVRPSSAQAVYLLKVSKPFVQQKAEFCAGYFYGVRHSKRTCCWLPTQWSDN